MSKGLDPVTDVFMRQARKPMKDELADLIAMLRPQTRWHLTWQSFCEAAYFLRTYAEGMDKATAKVLAAIVRIESTVEALQDQRLQAVERVALEYGGRLARLAWRRHELEAELRGYLAQSAVGTCDPV
jgi:hypothetical protein